MLSATENMYRAMDIAHAGVQHARKLWDAADPQHSGGTGQRLPSPDWARMDADYLPPECRGWAGMSEAEQRAYYRARVSAMGIQLGPARAHGSNLTGGGPVIDIEDGHQLADVVRSVIRDFVRNEAAPKIQKAVTATINRMKGRVD